MRHLLLTNPKVFLELLKNELEQSRSKPLFLATHFCLPHQPYVWAGLNANQFTYKQRYLASIIRVDQQISIFMQMLKRNQLLNHAIVIILSDHGEALELSGDRITDANLFVSSLPLEMVKFYPPSLDKEGFDQSAGHGTDVLGLSQYRTLLAFKFYNIGKQEWGSRYDLVTLLSIKPTILDAIGLEKLPNSLLKHIQNRSFLTKSKPIYLESDYSPAAIRTVYPEARKVMLEGIHLFTIDPVTTRLTIRPEMGQMIINSKQYAVIQGHWILASYPQKNGHIEVQVDLNSGLWTINPQRLNIFRPSYVKLVSSLKNSYSNEIK